MMTLRHLEVFYAIMRTGSVTAAARQLNISQPAVSSILKHCETRMKLRLFERISGRLQPTPEANALFQRVAEVHGRLEAIEQLMEDLSAGRFGSLSIAASLTITNGYLARAVASFTQERPNVRVSMFTMPIPQVVERVVSRQVELGVAYGTISHPEIETERFMRYTVAAVMRSDHPLAARKRIEIRDLAPHNIILYSSRGMLRSIIDRSMEQSGVTPRSTIQVNLSLTAIVLALENAGIALVDPQLLSALSLQGLVARPLRPRIELTTCLIRAKSSPRSVVMNDFVGHLKRSVQELPQF
jgi:DNA-binding transcriptional LysR family regulator